MVKIAVVTGSSGGVGKETACELAGKGFHVVFACRSEEKAAEAIKYTKSVVPKAETTFLQLDTGKMASVKKFATDFKAEFDRLDVLVHNAGSGYFLNQDRTTEDGLEAFFQTNYLGPFLLTKLFLDYLKKSNGRVVCVTSIKHWEGSYDFEKGCQTTVYAATTEKLPRGPVYYTPYKQWKTCPILSDTIGFFNGPTEGTADPRSLNESVWTKLWDLSEEKVKPFL